MFAKNTFFEWWKWKLKGSNKINSNSLQHFVKVQLTCFALDVVRFHLLPLLLPLSFSFSFPLSFSKYFHSPETSWLDATVITVRYIYNCFSHKVQTSTATKHCWRPSWKTCMFICIWSFLILKIKIQIFITFS